MEPMGDWTVLNVKRYTVHENGSTPLFYNNRWCGLNDPPLTVNGPKKYKDLVEIPVTVFKSFDLCGIKRFDAISLDSISRYEFRTIFAGILKEGVPRVVVLMLHSFSLIKRDKRGNLKGINRRAIIKVEELIKFLSQQEEIDLVTAKGLWETINGQKESFFVNDKFVPSIRNKLLQYVFTFRRASSLWGKNKKATFFILLNMGGVIALGVVIALVLLHS